MFGKYGLRFKTDETGTSIIRLGKEIGRLDRDFIFYGTLEGARFGKDDLRQIIEEMDALSHSSQ